MTTAPPTVKQIAGLIIAFQLLMPSFVPVVVFAQTPAEQSAPTATQQTGPTEPTGADAPTYKLNPETGLYENGVYTWNPATGATKPIAEPSYTFNEDTNKWSTSGWQYQPESGTYTEVVTQVDAPPAGTNTSSAAPAGSATVSSVGPGSQIDVDRAANSSLNSDTSTTVRGTNNIASNAITGNAIVTKNTKSGSALTGNASASANVLNLLNSSWYPDREVLTFTANIDGDVFGDLIVDPAAISGPDSRIRVDNVANNDIQIKVATDANIDNSIQLAAVSGDAEVSGNTEAGDARSGNADVMANVINTLNSAVNSGDSFIGNININGNLEGDILFPEGFIDTIINNTGPNSVVELSDTEKQDILLNINDNVAIQNNINSDAQTGNAEVSNNTAAGSAISGQAATDVKIVNLTGKEVVGLNSLLTFINVRGEWLGLIMDSPTQARTALLGGGLGPNSSVDMDSVVDNAVAINLDTDYTINNNLDLRAQSGDATVTGNTSAGDALTGNASTIANITNITNSNFNLSGWFGILYINIMGDWRGSFGVDTPFGNPVAANTGGAPVAASSTQSAANAPANQPVTKPAFAFRSSAPSTTPAVADTAPVIENASATIDPTSTVASTTEVVRDAAESTTDGNSNAGLIITIAITSALAFIAIGLGERILAFLRGLA